jgi:hypothetical protein
MKAFAQPLQVRSYATLRMQLKQAPNLLSSGPPRLIGQEKYCMYVDLGYPTVEAASRPVVAFMPAPEPF